MTPTATAAPPSPTAGFTTIEPHPARNASSAASKVAARPRGRGTPAAASTSRVTSLSLHRANASGDVSSESDSRVVTVRPAKVSSR